MRHVGSNDNGHGGREREKSWNLIKSSTVVLSGHSGYSRDMKVLQRCANPHLLIIIIYIIPIKSQNRGQENSQDLLRMLLCSIQVKPDFSGTRQCLSPARELSIKAARVESSIKTFNLKHKKQQSKYLLVANQSTDN